MDQTQRSSSQTYNFVGYSHIPLIGFLGNLRRSRLWVHSEGASNILLLHLVLRHLGGGAGGGRGGGWEFKRREGGRVKQLTTYHPWP